MNDTNLINQTLSADYNLIAFMPLRKGSKGIPNKNTRSFLGKELFRWVLDTIISTSLFHEIWIATDDDHVKSILLEKYPDNVKIFHRSDKFAQDTSPTIDVVKEFIDSTPLNDKSELVLFQATSPFTSKADINKFVKQLKSSKCESAIACCRMKRFRWSKEGESLDYDLTIKPRRQDYQGFLVESGAIYASKIGNIRKTNQLISGKVSIVEIDEAALVEIDEPLDWTIGELYAKELNLNGR